MTDSTAPRRLFSTTAPWSTHNIGAQGFPACRVCNGRGKVSTLRWRRKEGRGERGLSFPCHLHGFPQSAEVPVHQFPLRPPPAVQWLTRLTEGGRPTKQVAAQASDFA